MKKILEYISKPALVLPLIFFVISRAFAYWIALQGNCGAGLEPLCWFRWDSGLYLDIAEKGHQLFHCGPVQGYANGSTEWCGTAGWAPLYPFLIKLLHSISHVDLKICAIWISATFLLGYLFVAAQLLEIKKWNFRSILLMIIVTFCPGNIYFHAIYPIAQAVFFLSLFYLMLQRNKLIGAGISAFWAIWSYSIGFFILPVLFVYAVYLFSKEKKQLIPFVFRTFIPAILGIVTLWIYDQVATGHWDAMFLIQGKYGHGLNSPLKIFYDRFQWFLLHRKEQVAWIEIFNFFLIIFVLFMGIYFFRKRKENRLNFFTSIWFFILWFLPYSASLDVALYRNVSITAPGHTESKTFPLWALALLAGVFVLFSYEMGVLFMLDKLK